MPSYAQNIKRKEISAETAGPIALKILVRVRFRHEFARTKLQPKDAKDIGCVTNNWCC